MALDIWGGVIQGFSTGIGVGLSNWIFIKRLEKLEERLFKRKQEDEPNGQ